MNAKERCEVVRAMETLARAVNDENVLMYWLALGVADGDINTETTDADLVDYIDNKTFAELMEVFLRTMERAKKSGGLYVDGVVSRLEE